MSKNTVYVLPPSYAQQRMWLACQMDKTSSAYNIVKASRIRGRLNVEALERSLNEVIRRHEVLRTTFEEEDGQPMQIIREAAELRINVEPVSGSTLEERRKHAEAEANRESGRGFNLSKWPLLRVRLLRVEEDEHLLVVVLHHIIADGWSVGVMMRELDRLYGGYARGEAVRLAELEVQYADYAAWQREWLEGGEMARQLGYWREQLQGAPPALEMPTDYARPAQMGYRGRSEKVEVSEAAVEGLRRLGRQEGVTAFMEMLGGLAVLLWRQSGQGDIVIGTPIANRSRAEVEGVIGFFVNTLAVRVRVEGRESYRGLLKKVREAALGAYANQDVPFEKLVEELRPDRDSSRSPLFQVMFAVQNQPSDEIQLQGLNLEALSSEYDTSKFDLTLTLTERGDVIRGAIRYNTDLFRADTIKRMARRFERLLDALVRCPDASLHELEMIGDEEAHQLLREWNDTRASYPASPLAHALFEREAAIAPDAIAVSDASGTLTYGELDRQANRLAHYLRERGIGPERVVGICMDRSQDLIISELAVLKAGGAYLPLDPAYPPDRIAYMLESSQAPLLLTRQALGLSLDGLAAEVIAVDSIRHDLAHRSSASPHVEIAPENLAYLIYTSGSTGRPKGVGVPHASLLNLIHWTRDTYQVTAADRATLLAGISFDAAVWETWPYLTAGASLHIPPEQNRSDVWGLIQWLGESSITRSFMATPMAELALAQPWPETSPLKSLFTGGEKLHWPCGAQYPFQVGNHYGPTENTVIATSSLITPDGRGLSAPPIGRPIGNTQVYVLDPTLRTVPVGTRGELYVGGLGLARGYIGQSDLTAERFIPNPCAEQAGERMYRTGDVARHLGEGDLEFWGRADEQIKIRGYRIEPGEIEAALLDYPDVRAAAVAVYEPPDGQKHLIAYMVCREPADGDLRESLKDHLRMRLPAYMVPAQFVFLDVLPLTPNGKLDKRRLPAPQLETGERAVDVFQSPIEEQLASLWSEIMRLKRVGRHDNFFEIGGHSLAAMQLVAKVRERFSVELNIRHIFEAPTLCGLADLISKKNSEGGDKDSGRIRKLSERRMAARLEQPADDEIEQRLGDRP
ncbi:MAG TPA: amino acid adenylation domain-containing protein [Blastocatellia bacterium]|nr:amino acid adenylation domain-containing protein [Blastocatellia bacterium]